MSATAEIAKAKDAFTKIEAAVKKDAASIMANPRWTSSRLWIAVVALIALVLLHRSGMDTTILAYVAQITIVILVLRTITDVSRDWGTVVLGIADRKYGKLAAAPGAALPSPAPVAAPGSAPPAP